MATRSLRKAYTTLKGSLRADLLKLCAYANRLRDQVQESSKKPTQTAYAKAVTMRIQEPTRAAYANPTRMHTFHKFAYATFKGFPFLYKSFHLKKNAGQVHIALTMNLLMNSQTDYKDQSTIYLRTKNPNQQTSNMSFY